MSGESKSSTMRSLERAIDVIEVLEAARTTLKPIEIARRANLHTATTQRILFVRVGWSRAVIARVEGTRPLRYQLPIGERLPLHLGAGKVLAAYLPQDEINAMLDAVEPVTTATGRQLTRDSFLTEMDTIRGQGYATTSDERVVGISAVSVPAITSEDECVAAIQVSGRTEDLDPTRLDPLSIEVRQAAAALTRSLT